MTALSLLGVVLLMQPRNILVDCINVHIHVYNVYIEFIDQENPRSLFLELIPSQDRCQWVLDS